MCHKHVEELFECDTFSGNVLFSIGRNGVSFLDRDFNTIDEIKKKLEQLSPEVLVNMVQTLHSSATPATAKVREPF